MENKNNTVKTASWVIKRIDTGEPVLETFDEAIVRKINAKKYKAVPILEHLASINQAIKNDTQVEQTTSAPAKRHRP